MVIVGSNSTTGIVIKSLVDSLLFVSDFSSSNTFTFYEIPSGTDSLISNHTGSLFNEGVLDWNPYLRSFGSLRMTLSSTTNYNVYYRTANQSFSVAENKTSIVTADLS